MEGQAGQQGVILVARNIIHVIHGIEQSLLHTDMYSAGMHQDATIYRGNLTLAEDILVMV